MRPPYIVTVTSKGQMSVPIAICRKLGVKPGTKFDIYPMGGESIRATVRRPSRILEYAGDLKHFDKKVAVKEHEGRLCLTPLREEDGKR